jgi:hypothetical protein
VDLTPRSIYVQVVELLIRKLEGETSFHRKVDLFFLVDSITQCSNNQKGENMYFIECRFVAFIMNSLVSLSGSVFSLCSDNCKSQSSGVFFVDLQL